MRIGRITGPRLALRDLEPSDVDGPYPGWLRDPEVTRFLEVRFSDHDDAGLRAYVAGVLDDPDDALLAIELEGEHVGNIRLGPIDRHHASAPIGILVGAKDRWGQGVATEAIALLAEHALGPLGLRKLTAGCYAGNGGSQRAFEKAGFAVEGRRRAQYVFDGERVDEILLGRVAS